MKSSSLLFLRDLGGLNLGFKKLFRLILMISARCPLQCRVCGIWNQPDKQEPSLSELESFFENNSLSWINLTGGEIFMREDLVDLFHLIAATQPCLAYLSFPTTGYRVRKTVRDMEEALRTPLSRIYVTVSFDGGRDTHDDLRGTRGAFERAAETFQALKELARVSNKRLEVIPGMTLSHELLERTQDPLRDLLQDLNLSSPHDVHVNLAHRSEHYYANPEVKPLPREALVKMVRGLARSMKFRGSPLQLIERVYLNGAAHYLTQGEAPLKCRACTASIFIDAGWTAYPCTIYSRALGNMKDLDFKLSNLMATPAFKQARSDIHARHCPGCWTPCEAYTAIMGGFLNPSLLRLALAR